MDADLSVRNPSDPDAATNELLLCQALEGRCIGFDGFRVVVMVAQICPRWNPLTSWLQEVELFRTAA